MKLQLHLFKATGGKDLILNQQRYPREKRTLVITRTLSLNTFNLYMSIFLYYSLKLTLTLGYEADE